MRQPKGTERMCYSEYEMEAREKSVAELLDERQRKAEQGPWVVACGGAEPVMTVKGTRVQYMWQPSTRRHAYYNLDNDMFLSDEETEILFS